MSARTTTSCLACAVETAQRIAYDDKIRYLSVLQVCSELERHYYFACALDDEGMLTGMEKEEIALVGLVFATAANNETHGRYLAEVACSTAGLVMH